MKVRFPVLRSHLSTERRSFADEDHHRGRDCYHHCHHRRLDREGNEALSAFHTTPLRLAVPLPTFVLCVFLSA